jgi:2-polyprenyl-6-methoxyphenol hydroxylase-like FAD-dependent oxidoreductase
MHPAGDEAVVVGAGIGGLCAAAALAPHVGRVWLLERDRLPRAPAVRRGVPQGAHVHNLLAGGQKALEELFPGIVADVLSAGAVEIRFGLDDRGEAPGHVPGKSDTGFSGMAMSRPLLEHCVRQRVAALPNVTLIEGAHVTKLLSRSDPSRIDGVEYEDELETSSTLNADVVLDCSGSGELSLSAVRAAGLPPPKESVIDVGLGYATATFEAPQEASLNDWRMVTTLADPTRNTCGALLNPIEGNRWMVTAAGRRKDAPLPSPDAFRAFISALWSPTIHRAIAGAERLGEVKRFIFPASVWRHWEPSQLPHGLIPFADAICRFNPSFGQGVSVAAQEAVILRHELARGGDDLCARFLRGAVKFLETPWTMVENRDFSMPGTIGTAPADLQARLQHMGDLQRLAATDPQVGLLLFEVRSLLRPISSFYDTALLHRIAASQAADRIGA